MLCNDMEMSSDLYLLVPINVSFFFKDLHLLFPVNADCLKRMHLLEPVNIDLLLCVTLTAALSVFGESVVAGVVWGVCGNLLVKQACFC